MKPRFTNISELGLSYKDQLIYTAIRSFYNTRDKYCYPSYKAISQRAGGISAKTISASIKRLDAAKMLEVWKIGKSRQYHSYKFPEQEQYVKIPWSIFDIPNLTMFERSMLITLFDYLDENYQTELTVKDIADSSGESYKAIYTQLKSLQMKGHICVRLAEKPEDRTLVKVIAISDQLRSQFPTKLETVKGSDQNARSEDILTMAVNMLRKGR